MVAIDTMQSRYHSDDLDDPTMSRSPLLVVHSQPAVTGMLASMLRPLGREVIEANEDREAIRGLAHGPAVVLPAADPPDPAALGLLTHARRKHPDLPVVVLLLGPATPSRVTEGYRLGATAVLDGPIAPAELRAVVALTLDQERGLVAPPAGKASA